MAKKKTTKKQATRKKATKKVSKKKTAKKKTAAGAKRVCATMEQHFHLAAMDATYRANRRQIETFSRTARVAPRTAIARIPVVVHVLYNDDPQDIGQEQIDAQIGALNRDFRLRNDDRTEVPEPFRPFVADTLIEFALAVRDPQGCATTGVTRTFTSLAEFPYDDFDPEAITRLDELIKHDEHGIVPWPREDYLNLWVCSIEGGLLGYAQFPGGPASTDGVVINNTAFGSGGIAQAPFDLGRTGVHEVGHYLNLLHIWGDDDGACSASDNVADTPNQAGANTQAPTFPRVSCNNGPHGDMFMNYMDYVDDAAMMMFTRGQLARMNAALAGPRASLLNSQGLVPVETEPESYGGVPAAALESAEHRAELGGTGVTTVFDGVSWVPMT
jgi:hypothetical protein